MNRCITHTLLALLLASQAMAVQAVSYGASLNHAEWRVESSPFECRLWQPVPYFGDAVFSHQAGKDISFYLAPTRKSMKAGKATLVSRPPVWNEARHSSDMGEVKVSNAKIPVRLGKKRSFQLINELYDGMSPVFSRGAWYNNEPVELALSSVNFRKAFSQYNDCLATLLPVNFDQINRSRLHFQTAQHELTPYSKTKLDHVVLYVKADPSVTSFYIDGHTDDVGRRVSNLDLSKRRAEAVTRYLMANGVDEAMITTRYHGERYPVAKNNSNKNRAGNRRVTIRLERESL